MSTKIRLLALFALLLMAGLALQSNNELSARGVYRAPCMAKLVPVPAKVTQVGSQQCRNNEGQVWQCPMQEIVDDAHNDCLADNVRTGSECKKQGVWFTTTYNVSCGTSPPLCTRGAKVGKAVKHDDFGLTTKGCK